MTNDQFNKMIRGAFNNHALDDDLNHALYHIWVNYDLTDEQVHIIENIKADIDRGLASSAELYTIK